VVEWVEKGELMKKIRYNVWYNAYFLSGISYENSEVRDANNWLIINGTFFGSFSSGPNVTLSTLYLF